jgi:hypothetical protein
MIPINRTQEVVVLEHNMNHTVKRHFVLVPLGI